MDSETSSDDDDGDDVNPSLDEDDDDELIETVDDMTGSIIDDTLKSVLEGLVRVGGVEDDTLVPFTQDETVRWLALRASATFDPSFGIPLGVLVGRSGQQGKRHSMEDHDVVFSDLNATLSLPLSCPDQAFFGVYDGHDGDEVSKILAEQLHKFVRQAPDFDTDPVAALMTGFLVRGVLIDGVGNNKAGGKGGGWP